MLKNPDAYLSLNMPHTLRDWVEILMMATSSSLDSGEHFKHFKFNPILYTGFNQSCYYTPKIPTFPSLHYPSPSL